MGDEGEGREIRLGPLVIQWGPWKCPKQKYGHETTARAAADAMERKKGEKFDAYYHEPCAAWHVGHSRDEGAGRADFPGEIAIADAELLGRCIGGALRSAIEAHGPITAEFLSSAEKRIVGALRNYNSEIRLRVIRGAFEAGGDDEIEGQQEAAARVNAEG